MHRLHNSRVRQNVPHAWHDTKIQGEGNGELMPAQSGWSCPRREASEARKGSALDAGQNHQGSALSMSIRAASFPLSRPGDVRPFIFYNAILYPGSFACAWAHPLSSPRPVLRLRSLSCHLTVARHPIRACRNGSACEFMISRRTQPPSFKVFSSARQLDSAELCPGRSAGDPGEDLAQFANS